LYEKNQKNIEDENLEMLAIVLTSSIIKNDIKNTSPFYLVVLLKKVDDNWVSYQTHPYLNLNELNVLNVKCKIENDKTYLLFIDSIDENTSKAKYYDLQDMYATTRVVETKRIPSKKEQYNSKKENQPVNTTKCRVFKPTFLHEKENVKSKKTHQLPKGLFVYVYLNSYKEMPGKWVRCVCYDEVGKVYVGYVLTSVLEWLQAG
jgi:hypothetical protein